MLTQVFEVYHFNRIEFLVDYFNRHHAVSFYVSEQSKQGSYEITW
jgi:hypothetical protein